MAKKVTITSEDDILAFVDRQVATLDDKANRSGYINAVLAAHRHSILEAVRSAALKQDAEAPKYQADVAVWDSVAGDRIDAAVN